MFPLGGVVQLKSIAIEERPVWRLHWSAVSSQRECIWQFTRFGGRKWRSGVNRISHSDWVKLSVELNLRAKPKYEIFLFSTSVTWRERVSTAMEIGKKRKSVWRRRIYRKYMSWNRLKKKTKKKRETKSKRGRSFTQVTWFSWPMVSRDWICVRLPYLLWEQVAYRPNQIIGV